MDQNHVTNQTSDPYAAAGEVGRLLAEIRELKDKCRWHAGNVVEARAYATACDRHLPHMRGCAWRDNAPCACRASVSAIWPEYAP